MKQLARKELDAFHALTAAFNLLRDTQKLVNPFFPFGRKARALQTLDNARHYMANESLKAYDIYIEQVAIEWRQVVATAKNEMSKLMDERARVMAMRP